MKKLLIVEDDDDSRELLVEILQNPEYELVSVASVAEAIRALKTHTFTALLLDGCLGDGDAWDILKTLPIANRPAVVLITGSENFNGDRPGQLLPGIDAFFRKPFNPLSLLPVVRTLCRGSI